MGRTQLQDAVPVRLGQCFNAYATMVSRDIDRLIKSLDEMKTVNLGATAIGTSINHQAILLSLVACVDGDGSL